MSSPARPSSRPQCGVVMFSDIQAHPTQSLSPRDWLPGAEAEEIVRIDASRTERKAAIDRVADAQIAALRESLARKAALPLRRIS